MGNTNDVNRSDRRHIVLPQQMQLAFQRIKIAKKKPIFGPTELRPALNRFKNQLNENAARFARIGVIPEMNHNESVAWGGVGTDQDASSSDHVLLLLTWQGMHRQVSKRMDWMVAHATTDLAWKIAGEGNTLLESMLHLCILMDWISIALALLHGKDPAAIGPIMALKAHLESVQ